MMVEGRPILRASQRKNLQMMLKDPIIRKPQMERIHRLRAMVLKRLKASWKIVLSQKRKKLRNRASQNRKPVVPNRASQKPVGIAQTIL